MAKIFINYRRVRAIAGVAAVAVLILIGVGGYVFYRHIVEQGVQQAELKLEEERRAAEAEAKRKADEAEQQRLAAKAEQERQARAAAEAEAKRKADEAEQQRLAAVKAEQEQQAGAAPEAEAKRKAPTIVFGGATPQAQPAKPNVVPPAVKNLQTRSGGGQAVGGVGGPPQAQPAKPNAVLLPEFPWPPPTASSSYVLPDNLFESRRTVGAVVAAIISALERNGYVERSFFRTEPGGIGLVTRLERIKDDGSSFAEGERWPPSKRNYASTGDLAWFLYGLFFVDPGHYRVIVFILQDLPFSQSTKKITGEEARLWLSIGANILPPEISERPFGNGHCTVLIYEFSSDGKAVRVVESRLTGKQHLEKAGVLSLLEKAN